MTTGPAAAIYDRPDDYDREHAGATEDIAFFVSLAQEHQPRRILEIACGTGRVTIPLAQAAGAWGGRVEGVEIAPAMLEAARSKPDSTLVQWHQGDVRQWRAKEPFDLIVSPCASLSHLRELEEQLEAWRTAHANLAPGGRFIVTEQMPNLPVLAESMQVPPKVSVELDGEWTESADERRHLLRYRTTRYQAASQTAAVRYLYDTSSHDRVTARSTSDCETHVYFPRELQLLFVATGFTVEAVWGDYQGAPLQHCSRQIIIAGRK